MAHGWKVGREDVHLVVRVRCPALDIGHDAVPQRLDSVFERLELTISQPLGMEVGAPEPCHPVVPDQGERHRAPLLIDQFPSFPGFGRIAQHDQAFEHFGPAERQRRGNDDRRPTGVDLTE